MYISVCGCNYYECIMYYCHIHCKSCTLYNHYHTCKCISSNVSVILSNSLLTTHTLPITSSTHTKSYTLYNYFGMYIGRKEQI